MIASYIEHTDTSPEIRLQWNGLSSDLCALSSDPNDDELTQYLFLCCFETKQQRIRRQYSDRIWFC
jgi:hypothetical protein